jgi:hypothetical protein
MTLVQILLPVLKSTPSRSVVPEPGIGTKNWSMAQNLCFGGSQQGRNKKMLPHNSTMLLFQ